MTTDERARIEAAMGRLLGGIPLRSDGKLTDLKDRFYARVKAQNAVQPSEAGLREQLDGLRRKLGDLRAERDEYKQAADALARALNVLTIENESLRSQIGHLRQQPGPAPLAPATRK